MTRRQLNLAAKLYGLATMAHLDNGDDSPDDQLKVRTLAMKRARASLRAWNVYPSEILTVQDAIDKAKEMRP